MPLEAQLRTEMVMATASLLQRERGLQRYGYPRTHHIKEPKLHMLLHATHVGITHAMYGITALYPRRESFAALHVSMYWCVAWGLPCNFLSLASAGQIHSKGK